MKGGRGTANLVFKFDKGSRSAANVTLGTINKGKVTTTFINPGNNAVLFFVMFSKYFIILSLQGILPWIVGDVK